MLKIIISLLITSIKVYVNIKKSKENVLSIKRYFPKHLILITLQYYCDFLQFFFVLHV